MDKLSDSFTPFVRRWLALPRERHPLLPCRSDLSPTTFGEFLPQLCVTESIAPMKLPIVYAGTAFERAAGYPLTGINYYALLPEGFRKSVAQFHAFILKTPCAAFVRDVITTDRGSRYLHETLHLPMADDEGNVRYVIAYGMGRRPLEDRSERPVEDQRDSHIKDLRYLNLGAGAPAGYIKNFVYYKPEHEEAPLELSSL